MRIVIKVGTSTLCYENGRMNIRQVEGLIKVISDLKNAGNEIVLVSSGAIGFGVGKLNLNTAPRDIPTRQALAAVGQCELMYTYDKLFDEYNISVGQILLTAGDFNSEERKLNFMNTLSRLLEMNVLTVINENDTVATEEISVGDNDTLSALVSVCAGADLLVLLSDIDGLYTADPHRCKTAKLIETVERITPEIEALGGGKGSKMGTGGMITKISAAKIATENGVDMVIANGAHPELLYDIIDGKPTGTRFLGKKK